MAEYPIPSLGSHNIPLDQAVEMTTLYRENCNEILKSEYQNQAILPLNETFNASDVQALLSNENAVGLRIYYGMSTDLKVHAILVGVDKGGNDILPSFESEANGQILEDSLRCPVDCPEPSPLNS